MSNNRHDNIKLLLFPMEFGCSPLEPPRREAGAPRAGTHPEPSRYPSTWVLLTAPGSPCSLARARCTRWCSAARPSRRPSSSSSSLLLTCVCAGERERLYGRAAGVQAHAYKGALGQMKLSEFDWTVLKKPLFHETNETVRRNIKMSLIVKSLCLVSLTNQGNTVNWTLKSN